MSGVSILIEFEQRNLYLSSDNGVLVAQVAHFAHFGGYSKSVSGCTTMPYWIFLLVRVEEVLADQTLVDSGCQFNSEWDCGL
jgi:hypothetical protein